MFDWMTDEDEILIAIHDHHHPCIQQLIVSLYRWIRSYCCLLNFVVMYPIFRPIQHFKYRLCISVKMSSEYLFICWFMPIMQADQFSMIVTTSDPGVKWLRLSVKTFNHLHPTGCLTGDRLNSSGVYFFIAIWPLVLHGFILSHIWYIAAVFF